MKSKVFLSVGDGPLSISKGSVFPDYLEVATAVVVPRGIDKTSPHT